MVIFHGYVSLPEGKLNESESVDFQNKKSQVSRIQKGTRTCVVPPLLQTWPHLASARLQLLFGNPVIFKAPSSAAQWGSSNLPSQRSCAKPVPGDEALAQGHFGAHRKRPSKKSPRRIWGFSSRVPMNWHAASRRPWLRRTCLRLRPWSQPLTRQVMSRTWSSRTKTLRWWEGHLPRHQKVGKITFTLAKQSRALETKAATGRTWPGKAVGGLSHLWSNLTDSKNG